MCDDHMISCHRLQEIREVYVIHQLTTASHRVHKLSLSSAIEIQHRGHLCLDEETSSRWIGAVLSNATIVARDFRQKKRLNVGI